MASTYSGSAVVVNGGWSSETRKHPALKYLESLVHWMDSQDHENMDFHHDDFSIITPHKEHFTADQHQPIPNSIEKFYTGPFTEFKHVPATMVAIESKDGWDLHIQFHLFANLRGTPVQGEEKVKDEEGKEWDIEIPTFHYFDVVKDANAKHGLETRHIKFVKDTGAVNDILRKRGHKQD